MDLIIKTTYSVDGGPDQQKAIPTSVGQDFVVDDPSIFSMASLASSHLAHEGQVEILDVELTT